MERVQAARTLGSLPRGAALVSAEHAGVAAREVVDEGVDADVQEGRRVRRQLWPR